MSESAKTSPDKKFVPLHTFISSLVINKLQKDRCFRPNDVVEYLIRNLHGRSAKIIQDDGKNLPEYSLEGRLLAAQSPDNSLFVAFMDKFRVHLFREHDSDGKYNYPDCVVLV